MKVLVIPDVHLKPVMFQQATVLMRRGIAERAVCLMDIPDDWGKEYEVELYENTYDEAINFAKKFDLILNAIYYNILLCIVLLLTSLIVSVKVVSRINAIKVVLVYLFISYLYIFIRRRRDKNERIIIRNKK